jgi:hypothetical protein
MNNIETPLPQLLAEVHERLYAPIRRSQDLSAQPYIIEGLAESDGIVLDPAVLGVAVTYN